MNIFTSLGRRSAGAARDQIRGWLRAHRVELLLAGTVFFCCAYFFQGGGWNQNAFYATTVAIVDDGTVYLDDYRKSTGDLSWAGPRTGDPSRAGPRTGDPSRAGPRTGDPSRAGPRAGRHVASAKAITTSLLAIPAYLVACLTTAAVDNPGNRIILKAYLTTTLTAGLALALFALLLFHVLGRRLVTSDAAWLTLAICLATPLFPNSTMLTSHPIAALAALGAYALLETPRLRGEAPSARTLLFAGLAAGGAVAAEYLLVVLLLPLGAYALWQCRGHWRRLGWFAGGVACVALVPVLHHSLLYGHPLHTGYASLVNSKFALRANQGFMGFVGFNLGSLFELTLGQIRGFFFLSPLLAAVVPGVIRAVREPTTRPEGLVCGSIAWGVLLLVACLVYWHSGSAVGSRYALVFIPFAAITIAGLVRDYRRWLQAGAAVGFVIMLIATSVTAIPPPPGRPPYENVITWLWERFSVGNLASWQQAIIVHRESGTGDPTLPFSFNLGQLLGLPGLWALLPWAVGFGMLIAALIYNLRRLRENHP